MPPSRVIQPKFDPNQNGVYLHYPPSGFSSSDIGKRQQRNSYVPVPLATSEVNADLRRGSSGSFSELCRMHGKPGFLYVFRRNKYYVPYAYRWNFPDQKDTVHCLMLIKNSAHQVKCRSYIPGTKPRAQMVTPVWVWSVVYENECWRCCLLHW